MHGKSRAYNGAAEEIRRVSLVERSLVESKVGHVP